MIFSSMEKNMTDVIKEQQAKLGYRSESVYLFYPLLSLNRLLGTDQDAEKMMESLSAFCDWAEPTLGRIEASRQGDRFCLIVPAKGADYVHAHTGEKEFIAELVKVISRPGAGIDDVLALFHVYSDAVHVERVSHPEYDYLIYFEQGQPDAYRYCVKDERVHLTYHRYTPEDYRDFYAEA